MINKINLYILNKFLICFILTLIVFSIILFIGDFVEQFRKSAGKNVPINIIFQLASYNFPNLISFTLPITAFFSSIMALIILIRNSEIIVLGSAGISSLKITLPAIALYLVIGILFVSAANPLISIFNEKYSELEYKYIDRVDKFASITKNGLWLKQENLENNFSSVLYSSEIKNQGKNLINFMILEYDVNGTFQGRIDGSSAELKDGYWEMKNVQISPKYDVAKFEKDYRYQTNIKLNDISDSLSSPTTISIWRLIKFINFLEDLGYSAIDFKMHFYELVFLPIFLSTLVLLAYAILREAKQNDKFAKSVTYSFIVIFILYFISNLLDALGSSAQIHPLIAKAAMPIITLLFYFLISQYFSFRRKKII